MAQKKQRKGLGDIIGGALDQPEDSGAAAVVDLKPDLPKPVKAAGVKTSLYLSRAVHRQIKELALTEDVKPHDLYLEALDMLFKQRGLKSTSDLKAS